MALAKLYKFNAEEKGAKLKKLAVLKEMADPEKSKKLFEISQTMYLQILNTDVEDDELNLKTFIEKVVRSLDKDDCEFFEAHKHKSFYKRRNLFNLYSDNQVQKDLAKAGYVGLRSIQKCRTLNQVINCIADAKIQQHKDILIKEYRALKATEALRHSLFKQEGFNQINDLNQRELLLQLKSNPELTRKAIIEKLNIPKTTAYNWIKDFKKLGVL